MHLNLILRYVCRKLDYEFETTANKYLSALKFKNKGPYHINKTINFNLDITNFVNVSCSLRFSFNFLIYFITQLFNFY